MHRRILLLESPNLKILKPADDTMDVPLMGLPIQDSRSIANFPHALHNTILKEACKLSQSKMSKEQTSAKLHFEHKKSSSF
jgi:hypothetical protein